jgi:hypothetical protein
MGNSNQGFRRLGDGRSVSKPFPENGVCVVC